MHTQFLFIDVLRRKIHQKRWRSSVPRKKRTWEVLPHFEQLWSSTPSFSGCVYRLEHPINPFSSPPFSSRPIGVHHEICRGGNVLAPLAFHVALKWASECGVDDAVLQLQEKFVDPRDEACMLWIVKMKNSWTSCCAYPDSSEDLRQVLRRDIIDP